MSLSGVLDSDFNTTLKSGFDAQPNSIGFLSDSSIIVGGNFATVSGIVAPFLAKLNSAGVLDGTFNANIGTGPNGNVQSVFVQPDDKIVVVGSFTSFNGNGITGVIRLNSDGTPDPTFVTTGANNSVFSVKARNDNSLVMCGNFTTFNGTSINRIVAMELSGTPELEELRQVGTFYGSYSFVDSAWSISDPIGAFDSSGIDFSISTSGTIGQLQYTSTDLSGTIVLSQFRWLFGGL